MKMQLVTLFIMGVLYNTSTWISISDQVTVFERPVNIYISTFDCVYFEKYVKNIIFDI